jgi:tetratricopeptide (TPR) repeat protein
VSAKRKGPREWKRPAEAIPCFDRVIEFEPKNHLGWYNKGVSLIALKRYKEALDCNERAIELDPNWETQVRKMASQFACPTWPMFFGLFIGWRIWAVPSGPRPGGWREMAEGSNTRRLRYNHGHCLFL